MSVDHAVLSRLARDLTKLEREIKETRRELRKHIGFLTESKEYIDKRTLLETSHDLWREGQALQEYLDGIVAQVPRVSRSARDASMHGLLGNVRGVSRNCQSDIRQIRLELLRFVQMADSDLGRDTGRWGDAALGPFKDVIGLVTGLVDLLVKARKTDKSRALSGT